MFKGALFDLDGVIANTADLHFKAWQKLARNYFKAELPIELEEKTKGISRSDSLQVILDSLKITLTPTDFSHLANEKNEIYKAYLDELTVADILPGIDNFIAELKTQHIRLALASASQNGPIILQKLGLATAFDTIVDPKQVAHGKPAPDIFIAAAQSLNLQPVQCIGLEDSIAGITAINASGAISIAIGDAAKLTAAHKIVADTTQLNLATVTAVFKH